MDIFDLAQPPGLYNLGLIFSPYKRVIDSINTFKTNLIFLIKIISQLNLN